VGSYRLLYEVHADAVWVLRIGVKWANEPEAIAAILEQVEYVRNLAG